MVNKDELRVKILNAMCDLCSNTEVYYETNVKWGGSGATNLHFVGEVPKGFKPGIADRLLLKHLLTDRLLDNIAKEWEFDSNYQITAATLLTRYFWSFYS